MADDNQTVSEDAELSDAEAEALWQEVNAAIRPDEPQDKADDQSAEDESEQSLADASEDKSDEPVDIWANANEAQRQAFDDLKKQHAELEHRLKSDDGRVSTLQKQINDLTAQLQDANKPPEKPQAHDEIPDALKSFANEFPDEAKALNAFMREQTSATGDKIAKLEQTIQELQQGSGNTFFAAMDIFKPDWRDVVNSNEFKQWLVIQPNETQALYSSANPSDGISLLRTYDKHVAETKDKADQLNKERKKRLSNAASTRTGRTEVEADGQDEDLDDLWERSIKNVRKKMHLSY